MRVISRPIIKEFIIRFPLSASSLNKWYAETIKSDWSNINEAKQTWSTCDFIGNDRYVFNIAGNNYRLVAMIFFKQRRVYIRRILTHNEYTDLSRKGELNTL